jgi:hypothetical protein
MYERFRKSFLSKGPLYTAFAVIGAHVRDSGTNK